jgi:hypothetical protein
MEFLYIIRFYHIMQDNVNMVFIDVYYNNYYIAGSINNRTDARIHD